MTRINVVPVKELSREHLIAEYRELPRVFGLVARRVATNPEKPSTLPTEYRLGFGHLLFFYDKLTWLALRHYELITEMQSRGYLPTMTGSLATKYEHLPSWCWGHYEPTSEALKLNRERIRNRLNKA